jgi:hypothetical protein
LEEDTHTHTHTLHRRESKREILFRNCSENER